MLASVCPCLACLINSFKQLFSDRGSKPIAITRQHESERIIEWKQDSMMSEEISNQNQNVISYATKQQVKSKVVEQPSEITESENGYGEDLLVLDDQERTLDFQQVLLNVPEYGPDYHLLKEKAYIAPSLLKLNKDWKMIKIKESGLQKDDQNFSRFQMKVWKKPDYKYLIQYELPCTYEAYEQINSRQIPTDLKMPLVKQFKILEQLQQNLTLRYICFDRIGMLESRYFTYLKYTTPCKTDPSAYWEICVSRQNDKNLTSMGGNSAKHGRLFIVSYIREKKNIEEGTTCLKVITYFDVDISTTVQKVWERIIIQTRDYLQQFCRKLTSNSDELL